MEKTSKHRLTLERGQMYGWTMYPGYFGHPYRSPVLIESVEPLGQRTYKIMFLNMFYAPGVQDMGYTLRTMRREASYIIAETFEDNKVTDRTVVIEPMNAQWITYNVPQWSHEIKSLFDPNGKPIFDSFHRLTANSY